MCEHARDKFGQISKKCGGHPARNPSVKNREKSYTYSHAI